ncbi:MAG: hypothetical protein Q9199_005462 [Rusavskia elegans]
MVDYYGIAFPPNLQHIVEDGALEVGPDGILLDGFEACAALKMARRFLQIFQVNLAQLRELCTVTELPSDHILRLDTNINQCMEDLKIAERRILKADRNMKSGNLRRTWALDNQQLQSPLANQAENEPPCSLNIVAASGLAKFLQTMAEPTALSGRIFRYINFQALAFCFRGGYVVIRTWTPEGQPVYYISGSAAGYGIEISVKTIIDAGLTGKYFGLLDCISQIANEIAASKKQASVVQLLLEQGADSDATTNTGDTPLHLAVRAKADFNLARTLLNHGADIECLNNRKRTPFHAFFSPIISQLAQHCPDSMSAITTDTGGMTLAHYFSWTSTSSPTDFQVLPNVKMHLKARDGAGRTPLHFAAQRGNIPVMEYLLSQYQHAASMQPDNEGNTPLHEAVQSSRAPAALTLLLAHGFSLEQRNKEGHTAVQHAVLWGTVPATEMLFERDPRVLAWRGGERRGVLALARRTENVDVEEWLLGRRFGEEEEEEEEEEETGVHDGASMPVGTGQISFARFGGWRILEEKRVALSVTLTVLLAVLLSFSSSSLLAGRD